MFGLHDLSIQILRVEDFEGNIDCVRGEIATKLNRVVPVSALAAGEGPNKEFLKEWDFGH